MGWIKITGKVVEFTGKLVQAEGFEEWAIGKGKEVVEKVALESGGRFFKARRAKKSMWDDLTSKFKDNPMFATAIGGFVKNYYTRVYNVASESKELGGELPEKSSITVLPRCVLNAWESVCWEGEFDKSGELEKLKGGPLLRSFFSMRWCDSSTLRFQKPPPSLLLTSRFPLDATGSSALMETINGLTAKGIITCIRPGRLPMLTTRTPKKN